MSANLLQVQDSLGVKYPNTTRGSTRGIDKTDKVCFTDPGISVFIMCIDELNFFKTKAMSFCIQYGNYKAI